MTPGEPRAPRSRRSRRWRSARKRARKLGGWVSARLAWLAAGLALAAAALLIVRQLRAADASPDSTTLGLFALAALFGFAFLAPRQTTSAMRRITRFKVGGVELGLAEIKRAERVLPPQEDDGVRSTKRGAKGYQDCVKRLKNRLNRVRHLVGLEAGKNEQVQIAEELRLKKLLSRDEETFVLDLLGNHDPVSDDWSTATEAQFLDATWAFATRFRALVWDRYVRQRLCEEGWFIAEYEQKRGHRPDFLAYRGGRWALIAARVGSLKEEKPDLLDKAAERLLAYEEPLQVAGRSIVLPQRQVGTLSEKTTAAVSGKVVMRELEEILGAKWEAALSSEEA